MALCFEFRKAGRQVLKHLFESTFSLGALIIQDLRPRATKMQVIKSTSLNYEARRYCFLQMSLFL